MRFEWETCLLNAISITNFDGSFHSEDIHPKNRQFLGSTLEECIFISGSHPYTEVVLVHSDKNT